MVDYYNLVYSNAKVYSFNDTFRSLNYIYFIGFFLEESKIEYALFCLVN